MNRAHISSSSYTGWRHLASEHGLALLVFTLVAGVLTWPLVLHLGTAFPSEPGEGAQDLWEKMWNLWWFTTALREGVNPFHTDMLFYPKGASLLFHPLNPTSALMALPFRLVAGPIVSYNIVVLLSFVLAGYAVFLLVRGIGCGHVAALGSGLAFTACSFHIFHMRLSHLELVPIQWLPFYALALNAVLRKPTLVSIGATVIALLLIIFTSLYLTLYAALLTVVWLLWKLWVSRHARSNLVRAITGLAVAALVVLAVAGPTLLIPMATEARQSTYMMQTVDASAQRAAGALDFVLPPATHPIRALFNIPAPRSNGAFVGYLPLILASIGAVVRPRHATRWFVLAVIAWLLSLGPSLSLYRALYTIPLFQVSRYPDRFAILTVLSVAVMAGLGTEYLLRGFGARGRMLGGSVLLGVMLLEAHPGTLRLTKPFENPFYDAIARESEHFSVLELPINRVNSAWLDMYAQTLHQHPIPNGTLARAVPRIPYEWMPMIQQLEHPDTPDDILVQRKEMRIAALRFFNLRYLVYHRYDGSGRITPPSNGEIARITGVPVAVAYEDAALVAYRFDVPEGPKILPTIIKLGSGWYDLENPGPDAHRWARDGHGTFDMYAPERRMVAIKIKLAAYAQPRRVDLMLDGQQIGQIDAQTWTSEIVTPPFMVEEGAHVLDVVSTGMGVAPREAENVPDDRPLTVGVWSLEVETR